MNNEDRFNSKYSRDPQAFSSPPLPIVTKAVKLMEGNTALELGVGNGRNAKYLLGQSLYVTGVDSSQKGLDLLHSDIRNNPSLQLVNSDVLDFQTTEQYDLILAIGLLHFLKLEDIKKLLIKMAEWTKPEGLHAIAVRMTQNNRGDLPHIFASNELRDMYEEAGWSIEQYQEFEKEGRKVASLIARKP